jgi:hypothetical protein
MRVLSLLLLLLLACEPVPDIRYVDDTPADAALDANEDDEDDGGWPLASADAGIETCALTPAVGDDSCGSCTTSLAAGCCAQVDACAGSAPCKDYLACVRSCVRGKKKPKGCLKSCAASHPKGADTGERVAACVPASCRAACLE